MNTLSLSMIVGKGEAAELERCLKSVQGPLFDEIVVCMTWEDREVERVAKTYANKVAYFPWVEDFSAARNHSLKYCSMDYFMWLDADDVIKPSEYKKLLELKPNLDKHGIIGLNYIYSHDENDQHVDVLFRERILRNDGSAEWIFPIHECLNIAGQKITRMDIKVDHYRPRGRFDANRNLSILEKEYAKPDCDPRMKYYYAKDLAEANQWEKAIPVIERVLQEGSNYADQGAILCRLMCFYYLNQKDDATAKAYAYRGLGYSTRYAEFYCFLGDIAKRESDTKGAIHFYERALACAFEGGLGQIARYYKLVPAQELYHLYHTQGDFAKSLLYNKLAMEAKSDPLFMQHRQIIWRDLEKNNQVFPAGETPIVAWLVPQLDLNSPSIRIRRYNVWKALVGKGVDTFIIYDYYKNSMEKVIEQVRNANIVVLTQYGEYDYRLAEKLKRMGKRLLFDHCEALFGYPWEDETMGLCDAVACCSTKLAQETKARGYNVAVIKDAVE